MPMKAVHHLLFILSLYTLEVPKPPLNSIWHYFQNNVILREQRVGETLLPTGFIFRPVSNSI